MSKLLELREAFNELIESLRKKRDSINSSNGVSIRGPSSVNQGETVTWEISNFDIASSYQVRSDLGTATINEKTITFKHEIGELVHSPFDLTIVCNGTKRIVKVPIQEVGILPPYLQTIVAGFSNNKYTFTFTMSPFNVYPAGSAIHTATDWEIASDPSFSTILWSSLNNSTNKTTVTTGGFDASLTLYLRVRYRGSKYVPSRWYTSPIRTNNQILTSYSTNFSTSYSAGGLKTTSHVTSWITDKNTMEYSVGERTTSQSTGYRDWDGKAWIDKSRITSWQTSAVTSKLMDTTWSTSINTSYQTAVGYDQLTSHVTSYNTLFSRTTGQATSHVTNYNRTTSQSTAYSATTNATTSWNTSVMTGGSRLTSKTTTVKVGGYVGYPLLQKQLDYCRALGYSNCRSSGSMEGDYQVYGDKVTSWYIDESRLTSVLASRTTSWVTSGERQTQWGTAVSQTTNYTTSWATSVSQVTSHTTSYDTVYGFDTSRTTSWGTSHVTTARTSWDTSHGTSHVTSYTTGSTRTTSMTTSWTSTSNWTTGYNTLVYTYDPYGYMQGDGYEGEYVNQFTSKVTSVSTPMSRTTSWTTSDAQTTSHTTSYTTTYSTGQDTSWTTNYDTSQNTTWITGIRMTSKVTSNNTSNLTDV